MRGADVLLEALGRAGVRKVFTLSGNHIMSLFDAALFTGIELIHVRHEATAVHMADAWARMTGEPGVALATGGPGHANAIGALYTAREAEQPVILLSGHAPLGELGMGAFQELRQADMAAPVCKASWTAQSAAMLAEDMARAFRVARSGRPGPVHVSLPTDLLEAHLEKGAVPPRAAFGREPRPLSGDAARRILEAASQAQRPVFLAPPALCTTAGRKLTAALTEATGVPVVPLESPRGLADATLGAVAEVLAEADLIVPLAKQMDFTWRFGRPPVAHAQCRFAIIDPDPALHERARKLHGDRVVLATTADAPSAVIGLIDAAGNAEGAAQHKAWLETVTGAMNHRPAEWRDLQKSPDARLHPAELYRQLAGVLVQHPDFVFVGDGGEAGQWAQAILRAPHRMINGVAGAIGPSIPFSLAAKLARPDSPVVAIVGDGTFGYHMAEFETAARCNLPFVAIVASDGRWNAEHQIQLREYGEARTHGLSLLPGARYDQVASALGGHGEFVQKASELRPALERAFGSGKPACVNVLTESIAAPVIRRVSA